jgi:hypothetical protein
MEDFVKNQTLADMDLDPESIYKQHPIVDYRSEEFGDDPEAAATMDQAEDDPEVMFDPNQLAFGEWSEFLITVDRNVKLWRGGRLESYRALVVGGNLNGCTYNVPCDVHVSLRHCCLTVLVGRRCNNVEHCMFSIILLTRVVCIGMEPR